MSIKSKYPIKYCRENIENNYLFHTLVLLAILKKKTFTTTELSLFLDTSNVSTRSKIRFLKNQRLIYKTVDTEPSESGGRPHNVWFISEKGEDIINQALSSLNTQPIAKLQKLFCQLKSFDRPPKAVTIAVIEAIHHGINTTNKIADHISPATNFASSVSNILTSYPNFFHYSDKPSISNTVAYAITPEAKDLYFRIISQR